MPTGDLGDSPVDLPDSSGSGRRSSSFTNDVVPVLSRFGCNSGGCHGKLAGQNGFKLSLRGYAPESDFESLARESQGRRINAVVPSESLLIRKAIGALPHGGGKRIAVGSPAEKVLLDWIQAGTPGPKAGEPVVERLELEPLSTTLKLTETRSILVTAVYSDGQKRDVTWLTQFASSNSGILEVSEAGTVQALRHGEAVIRASFQGQVGVATFTMPHETATQPEWYTARNNVIDDHVYSRLAALRIEPSPLCDDATFLRRASLHAIGTLPTPEEVRAFLADSTPDKRSKLIDNLLTRPEFIDYWALQLGDLLQNRKERDHDVRGTKGVRAMHEWLRQQLLANRSWREIASDVILAEGANTQNPAVGYFIVTVGEKNSEESEVADSVAQAFWARASAVPGAITIRSRSTHRMTTTTSWLSSRGSRWIARTRRKARRHCRSELATCRTCSGRLRGSRRRSLSCGLLRATIPRNWPMWRRDCGSASADRVSPDGDRGDPPASHGSAIEGTAFGSLGPRKSSR